MGVGKCEWCWEAEVETDREVRSPTHSTGALGVGRVLRIGVCEECAKKIDRSEQKAATEKVSRRTHVRRT